MIGNEPAMTKLYFWCQKVLPTVYDEALSYEEVLDKVAYKLNELIKIANGLPDYILETIKQYINGPEFQKIMAELLSNLFVNVKYPPVYSIPAAVGDGTANDYLAIQGCIDYVAIKGGSVFIPSGKYLTDSLTLKSNVSIIGQDRNSTTLLLAGGASKALMSGTVSNCTITEIAFDAKMDIQVDNIPTLSLTTNNVTISDVAIRNGSDCCIIEKNGGTTILDNIVFGNSIFSNLRVGGTSGTLKVNNITFGDISDLNGEAALISDADGDIYTDLMSVNPMPLFAEIDGNNNIFEGLIKNAVNTITNRGTNNIINFYANIFNALYNIYSQTVSGNKTESIEGDNALTVNGNFSQTVLKNKTVFITENSVTNAKKLTLNSDEGISLTDDTIINLTSPDLNLGCANPVTYKTPTVITPAFSGVPAKDSNGDAYTILVEGDLESLPKGVIFDSATKDKNNTLYVDTVDGVINTPQSSFYEDAGKNCISVRNTNHATNVYRVLTLNCPMRRALGAFNTPFSVDNMIKAQQYMVESGADFVCLEELAELINYPASGTLGNEYFENVNMFDNISVMTGNDIAEQIQPIVYGNGIASEIKRISSNGANFSMTQGVEPRGYYNEKYSINSKTVSVYATHLGLSVEERASQVSQLASVLQGDTSNIVIVGADWNMDLINNPVLVKAITDLGFVIMNTSRPTFPNTEPSVGIDNILVKGATKIRDGVVITEPDTNDMFDHYGYWVDLQF